MNADNENTDSATGKAHESIESVEDNGPLSDEAIPLDPDTDALEHSTELDAIDWGACRVLLLDDEAEDVELITRCLKEIGIHDIIRASSVQQAYFQLREDKDLFPDYLILELSLVGTNGIQFLAQLRAEKDERLRKLPAVVVTFLNSPEIYRRATNQDISGFLRKPVAKEQLRAALIKAKSGEYVARSLEFSRSWIDDIEESEDDSEESKSSTFMEWVKRLFGRRASSRSHKR